MDDETDIPLAAAIRSLRREIVAAVQEGQDEDVRFALGPIELELQVTMAREAGVEGGVKFWVVSVGGKRSDTSGNSHTVRLSLTPRLASAVDDDRPLIVGSEEEELPG
ncbi:MAG: hypothetical protein QOJ57_2555 [Thermoleophilaceae bacterium]|jgi:hypothetical protein|nr:hypothetical protein [Thermoleophilaceae bacterium]